MASNKSFISARIPDELYAKLESYAETMGESKSKVLIDALNKYLNTEDSNAEEEFRLENRVRLFEQWVFNRLADVENRVRALEELEHRLAAKQEGNSSQVLPQKNQLAKEIKRLMPG